MDYETIHPSTNAKRARRRRTIRVLAEEHIEMFVVGCSSDRPALPKAIPINVQFDRSPKNRIHIKHLGGGFEYVNVSVDRLILMLYSKGANHTVNTMVN